MGHPWSRITAFKYKIEKPAAAFDYATHGTRVLCSLPQLKSVPSLQVDSAFYERVMSELISRVVCRHL